MANYEQAPILKRKGVKERSGLFAYRPLELEAAICCCLGDRDMVALKTMLFFTGNSNDGDFRVAQKTIFDRMNISEKPYYLARKKLQAMGWIEYVEAENAIYINYDRIYADYKEYLKNATDGANNSPKTNSIQESAVLKENADRLSDNHEGSFQDSQQGGHQDGYNNIRNNRSNIIKKNISGGADAAIAAPPPVELEKQMKVDEEELSKWRKSELHRINQLFNFPVETYEVNKMYASEEFKQYQQELEKKRVPLRKKYGKLYKW